jgi:prepilin-type N-terminal cleavage/methylation domain-containing protein
MRKTFSPRVLTRPAAVAHTGFSLVELLVVIAIIGTLVGLLLPAVQGAREAGRRSACQNNLRQLGLAVHNYENSRRCFPPHGSTLGMSAGSAPWSGHALVLPFLEGDTLFRKIDFTKPYSNQANKDLFPPNGVATVRVDVLQCPSDPNSKPRFTSSGVPEHYPLCYGMNVGAFLVHDPATKADGGGAFGLDSKFRTAAFQDGLSKTLAMAEVKAFTPRFHDAGQPSSPTAIPAAPADVVSTLAVTDTGWSAENGHTEWVCGRAIHNGVTTTFAPNTLVAHDRDGRTYDIDVSSLREGNNSNPPAPTYAVITSRSHHAGSVGTLFLDGSVRGIGSTIDRSTWRALGTRAGGEAIGSDY